MQCSQEKAELLTAGVVCQMCNNDFLHGSCPHPKQSAHPLQSRFVAELVTSPVLLVDVATSEPIPSWLDTASQTDPTH